MQVNMNYDVASRQYSQAVQQAQSTTAADKTGAASKQETTGAAAKPDTDRVELSKDTDITKMSASDRAALVKSLKDDLNNQMSRFTNMMTQMFQKQGITASQAQIGRAHV